MGEEVGVATFFSLISGVFWSKVGLRVKLLPVLRPRPLTALSDEAGREESTLPLSLPDRHLLEVDMLGDELPSSDA